MIDVKQYKKSALFQKIEFNKGKIHISISEIIEHPIHFHDHLEILLVLKGKISVKSFSDDFVLGKGEFIFLNAYEIHGVKGLSGEDVVACIRFDLEMDPMEEPLQLYDISILKKYKELYAEIRERLVDIINLFYFRKRSDVQAADYAKGLIRFMNSNVNYVMFELGGSKNQYSDNKLHVDRLNSILNYMYLHYDENLSLENMANRFNISKFYFSHILKKCFNKPFRDMLNLVRVDRAELPILEGEFSMTQICHEVGFSSYQYFVKQFKEYFSMTPMQYRKKYEKETLKHRYINENPYNITEEQFKVWDAENNLHFYADDKASFKVSLEEGAYSVITLMEFNEECRDVEYSCYEIDKSSLNISMDGDEMIIKIKRKKT